MFKEKKLSLLNPSFSSPLVDVMTDLEYVRKMQLQGTTPGFIFFQLKLIFHTIESLSSARIEGNHTTLSDYLDSKLEGKIGENEKLQEIQNIEGALDYIDEIIKEGDEITGSFIRELHSLTVDKLSPKREGSTEPGAYRSKQVYISKSEHIPPPPSLVEMYMDELTTFINQKDPPKYDLMKVALAHHSE